MSKEGGSDEEAVEQAREVEAAPDVEPIDEEEEDEHEAEQEDEEEERESDKIEEREDEKLSKGS
jgi:hypothetical protein